MFYINQLTPNFKHASNEHYACLRYIIRKKLIGKYFTEPHPKGLTRKINKVNGIHSSVTTFLNDEKNLQDVLIGTPDVLNKIKSKFSSAKEIKSIKSLFNYDAFIKKGSDDTFGFYNAYHLAENLDIQTCVYCNRLYTKTIITDTRKFIARPTLDHWFKKSDYPLLALSFYNLVPSCNVCNSSVKGSTGFSLNQIFHPFYKHTNEHKTMKMKFSFTLEDHLNAQSKIVTRNKFSENSIKAMKLDEIYKTHSEEIRELIYLKKAYSDSYLSSLRSLLKINLSSEEVYRLAFGVYFEDENLIKRPLSKLKKDILIELGVVK